MSYLRTLTDEENLHCQAWRASALQLMPYMAPVLFGMRPVATDEVDTFAIDPQLRLYINFENVINLGPAFAAEGMLHEASHILAEHDKLASLAGVTMDERKAWNLAGDFAINDDLRDAGCSVLAAHGVFAAKIKEPDYETPLYYMDKLRAIQQAHQQKQAQQGNPSSGQGQSQGQGQGQQSPSQQGQGSQPGQGGQPSPSGQPGNGGQRPVLKGCGTGAGGAAGGFELGDDDLNGAAQPAGEGEKAMVKISTAAAIKKHIESKGIGSVPGGYREMMDAILTPSTTPWEQVLGGFMRRAVALKSGYHDTTYSRRNRRRMNEQMRDNHGHVLGRVIVPGHIKPVPSVHFYRDTSGSVSDSDLEVVTSEVVAIATRLGIRGDELLVSDVDTMVHKTEKFAGVQSIAEIAGRGGTSMGEAIVHACESHRKPSVIVIATDGETGWPTERPAIPVVVLLVNVRSEEWVKRVPEWAMLVEVKTDA